MKVQTEIDPERLLLGLLGMGSAVLIAFAGEGLAASVLGGLSTGLVWDSIFGSEPSK